MTLRVTHELHERRRGRNLGLFVLLAAFAVLIFGLTVVKVQTGGQLQGYDHVLRPEMLPEMQEETER
jgi:hypothetical protein